MRRELTGDTAQQIRKFIDMVGKAMGQKIEGSVHIITSYICDHCKDDEKEAFLYYVEDRAGKYWEHLCNDCYDELGCVIEW